MAPSEKYNLGIHHTLEGHGIVVKYYNEHVAKLQEKLIVCYKRLSTAYEQFRLPDSWLKRVGDKAPTEVMEARRACWLGELRCARTATLNTMVEIFRAGGEPGPEDGDLDRCVANAFDTNSLLRDTAIAAVGGQAAVQALRAAAEASIHEDLVRAHLQASIHEAVLQPEQNALVQFEQYYEGIVHLFYEQDPAAEAVAMEPPEVAMEPPEVAMGPAEVAEAERTAKAPKERAEAEERDRKAPDPKERAEVPKAKERVRKESADPKERAEAGTKRSKKDAADRKERAETADRKERVDNPTLEELKAQRERCHKSPPPRGSSAACATPARKPSSAVRITPAPKPSSAAVLEEQCSVVKPPTISTVHCRTTDAQGRWRRNPATANSKGKEPVVATASCHPPHGKSARTQSSKKDTRPISASAPCHEGKKPSAAACVTPAPKPSSAARVMPAPKPSSASCVTPATKPSSAAVVQEDHSVLKSPTISAVHRRTSKAQGRWRRNPAAAANSKGKESVAATVSCRPPHGESARIQSSKRDTRPISASAPCHEGKKKRSIASTPNLLEGLLEKQRAYFADMDAFELVEEEVSESELE